MESLQTKNWGVIFLMIVSLSCIASGSVGATEVVCTGLGDEVPIQAALDAGGAVTIQGPCTISSSLFMRNSTTLRGPGEITYLGTGQAIHLVDTNDVRVQDVTISSPLGGGFLFNNALLTRVSGVKVNALGGHGFILQQGAGLWARDLHINGTPNTGTRAFLLNGTWDSLWVSQTLFEQHDTGLRIGGSSGAIGNLFLTNVVMDRLASGGVGLHIEPDGTGQVDNVQAMGIWSSGGHAMLFNSTQTSGTVGTIMLTNWRASESPNGVWTSGTIDNLDTSQMFFQ